MSVNNNLRNLDRKTPVILLTDSEGLGRQGKLLRERLRSSRFDVKGGDCTSGHLDSGGFMEEAFGSIEVALASSSKND
jgi:RTX toxin RtxA